MAKKRLNKRLLTILVVVFGGLLVVAVVLAVQYRFRDPMPFLDQARIMVEQIKQQHQAFETEIAQISDPEQAYLQREELYDADDMKDLYDQTEDNFTNAFKYSRGNMDLKMKIGMELADYYILIKSWPRARNVWLKLNEISPSFVPAKRHTVEAIYGFCVYAERYTNSVPNWLELARQADLLIEIDPDESFGYLARARALLAVIDLGGDDEPEQTLEDVTALLEKVQQLGVRDVLFYHMQGQFALTQANQSSDDRQKEEWMAKAELAFQQGIDNWPEDPQACVNRLRHYDTAMVEKKFKQVNIASLSENREQMYNDALEYKQQVLERVDEYIERFPDHGELYHVKAGFLRMGMDMDSLEPMLEMYEKAVQVDPQEPRWAVELAVLYQLRSWHADNMLADVQAAFNHLRRAIFLPKANDVEVVNRIEVLNYRMRNLQLQTEMVSIIAYNAKNEDEKEHYLNIAEECFAELRDFAGQNSPATQIAQAALAQAQGFQEEAIKHYLDAEKTLEAQNSRVPILNMKLFYALRNTPNRSLAVKHAFLAIRSGHRSKKICFDILETLGAIGTNEALIQAGQVIDFFEQTYGEETLSKSQEQLITKYKIKTMMASGKSDEAKELLETLHEDSLAVDYLRVQVLSDPKDRIAALEKLTQKYPDNNEIVNSLATLYYQMRAADPDYLVRARQLIEKAILLKPDYLPYQQLLAVLDQGDADTFDSSRLQEQLMNLAQGIADPYEREMQTANIIRQQAMSINQSEEREKYQETLIQARQHYMAAFDHKPSDAQALELAFDISLMLEDENQAEALIEQVQTVDKAISQILNARLMLLRRQWQDVINTMDLFIEEHPTSILAHVLLAQAYNEIGQRDNALSESRRAIELDSTNMTACRLLVQLLHQQNSQQGIDAITHMQYLEMIQLLNNIQDRGGMQEQFLRLQLVYEPAYMVYLHKQLTENENITEENRNIIEQRIEYFYQHTLKGFNQLLSRNPQAIEVWKGLAQTHQHYLAIQTDPKKQEEIVQEIEKTFQDAIAANPNSIPMVTFYCMHLLRSNRMAQAEELLQDLLIQSPENRKNDVRIKMAQMYVDLNDIAKAQERLDEVFANDPQNIIALKMVAEIHVRKNEPDKAIEIYAKIIEMQDDPVVIARLAELMLQQQQLEEADALLEQARQKYPDDKTLDLISIQLEINKTNYDQAIVYADRVINHDTMNIMAYNLKAQALFYNQQIDDAVECVRQLRRIVGANSTFGRSFLAQLYAAQARYSDAVDELREVLKLNPNAVKERDQLVAVLLRSNRPSDVETLYDDTLELFPQSVDFHLKAAKASMYYADSLLQDKQQRLAVQKYTKAQQLLNKADGLVQQQKIKTDDVLDAQIILLIKMGKNQKVIDTLNPLLQQRGGHPRMLLYKAEALNRLGKQQEAFDAFEEALELTHDNPNASRNVLASIGRVGDPESILAWTKNKITERPDWVPLHTLIAQVYNQMGKHENAIASYETALNHIENIEVRVLVNFSLATTYELMGNRAKAIELCREVLRLDPDHVNTLNNLAYYLMSEPGKEEEAVKLAQRAYALRKFSPEIMDTYASALLKKQQFSEAELILRKAIHIKLSNEQDVWAEIYFHLGQALLGSGRTEEARQQFDTAIQQVERNIVAGDAETVRQDIEMARQQL